MGKVLFDKSAEKVFFPRNLLKRYFKRASGPERTLGGKK